MYFVTGLRQQDYVTVPNIGCFCQIMYSKRSNKSIANWFWGVLPLRTPLPIIILIFSINVLQNASLHKATIFWPPFSVRLRTMGWGEKPKDAASRESRTNIDRVTRIWINVRHPHVHTHAFTHTHTHDSSRNTAASQCGRWIFAKKIDPAPRHSWLQLIIRLEEFITITINMLFTRIAHTCSNHTPRTIISVCQCDLL